MYRRDHSQLNVGSLRKKQELGFYRVVQTSETPRKFIGFYTVLAEAPPSLTDRKETPHNARYLQTSVFSLSIHGSKCARAK